MALVKEQSVLRVRGLVVRFPGVARALIDGLDIDVGPGEVVGLIGANGSGKTTLLQACAGLIPYEDGSVEVCGERVDVRAGSARRNLGWAPDEHPIALKLSVREYLLTVAALHGLDAAACDAALAPVRSALRLAELENVWLEACSHGMTKRVALAGALIGRPRLLLLDEPESGLDSSATAHLSRLILQQRESGGAVLMATHRLEWADRICTRRLFVRAGRAEALEVPSAERFDEPVLNR